MAVASGEVQGAQVLDRAIAVLSVVRDNNRAGVRMAEIVRQLGLTQPTVHRLVRALEAQEFLERDPATGRYHLGTALYIFGATAATRLDLRRIAARALTRLAHQTEDTILLTLRRGWRSVVVAREEGEYPIRTQVVLVGDGRPLGISAGGAAILAMLDDGEIDEAIAANLDELTSRYPTFTPELIRERVVRTRAEGYSLNDGLVFPGSWGIAIGFRAPSGECIGALTVAAIEQRLDATRQRELAELVKRETEGIERALAHKEP